MAPTGTQAVDRAAELLGLVVWSPEPRSFSSLVEDAGLPRSTTSRLLAAMERRDLVMRDSEGCYLPGRLFAVHAARHDPANELATVAWPSLERLGKETGETVNLAVGRGQRLVQVAQVAPSYLLGATNWVDVDIPAHCSALGKVLLAHGALTLPSGRLERRTPNTVTNRAALERELANVLREGFAVSREELEPGLVSVAAPVRLSGGGILAAVSVSGPTARLSHRRVEATAALLASSTRALSSALSGRPRREGVA